MKQIFFSFILCVSLTSCYTTKSARADSVIKNKKSLINQWYGKEHFDSNSASKVNENESLDVSNGDESKEINAGKMEIKPPPQEQSTDANKKTTMASQESSEIPENNENLSQSLNLESSPIETDSLEMSELLEENSTDSAENYVGKSSFKITDY